MLDPLHYFAEEGKLYCENEAQSVELLFEHAKRVGIPLDSARAVRKLEPSMLR